jgi:alanyl aminopeptidase
VSVRFAALWLLLACAGCLRAARAPEWVAARTGDGDARLSDLAVPTHYRLALTVDPAQPTFWGEEWITVQVSAATSVVQLHARDLDIHSADAARPDGRAAPAQALPGTNGGLALAFAEPLTAGEYIIHIAFAGRFADGLVGLYRVRVGDAFYAFTQFEALHARRAFPCFDEPRFKTPWEISLRVPHGSIAAGNTPSISRHQDEGLDVVRFAESRPLPTYLIALAVGPFDVVDGPAGDVPLRMLTVRGKGDLAGYALQRTPRILAALADYFGRPYPYAKLDLVAVPDFAAGAMENPGLVTFRDTLVLMDRTHATAAERYECESVVAHELAHQWFGNLVTMAWWDDLWLNEGFATWMATKIVMTTAPEFHADLDALVGRNEAMQADGLAAARAVRQPITDGGDVVNAFDDITYDKGAAILGMLEAWVGEEQFRAGVRAYITAHAWRSARTDDLLAALERATGQAVADVAATLLDQPGTPLLAVATVCDGRTATIHFQQSRYLPEGSHAQAGKPWHLPVCVKYGTPGEVQRQCVLITAERADVTLDAVGCPLWIHPNAGETGYYRWRLPDAELLALVNGPHQRLTAAEEVALPGHLDALLVAAQLDGGIYLGALARLMRSNHRQVVQTTLGGLHRIHHATVDYAGGASETDFAAYVRRSLGAQARRLGMLPKPGEDSEAELLRAQVLPAVADLGHDPALRAQARELTRRFLTDPGSVSPAAAQIAVPIAARDGNAQLHDGLVAALRRADNPRTRSIALSGLGNFRDPVLYERSLQLYFTDTLRVGDFWSVAGHAGDTAAKQAVAFAWLEANFDVLARRLGDDGVSSLPFVGSGFCDPAGRERVQRFFDVPAHQRPGSARSLAQTLEGIDQCMRLRTRATDSVRSFLQRLKLNPIVPVPVERGVLLRMKDDSGERLFDDGRALYPVAGTHRGPVVDWRDDEAAAEVGFAAALDARP